MLDEADEELLDKEVVFASYVGWVLQNLVHNGADLQVAGQLLIALFVELQRGLVAEVLARNSRGDYNVQVQAGHKHPLLGVVLYHGRGGPRLVVGELNLSDFFVQHRANRAQQVEHLLRHEAYLVQVKGELHHGLHQFVFVANPLEPGAHPSLV